MRGEAIPALGAGVIGRRIWAIRGGQRKWHFPGRRLYGNDARAEEQEKGSRRPESTPEPAKAAFLERDQAARCLGVSAEVIESAVAALARQGSLDGNGVVSEKRQSRKHAR